jgi:hypothetical protein
VCSSPLNVYYVAKLLVGNIVDGVMQGWLLAFEYVNRVRKAGVVVVFKFGNDVAGFANLIGVNGGGCIVTF